MNTKSPPTYIGGDRLIGSYESICVRRLARQGHLTGQVINVDIIRPVSGARRAEGSRVWNFGLIRPDKRTSSTDQTRGTNRRVEVRTVHRAGCCRGNRDVTRGHRRISIKLQRSGDGVTDDDVTANRSVQRIHVTGSGNGFLVREGHTD